MQECARTKDRDTGQQVAPTTCGTYRKGWHLGQGVCVTYRTAGCTYRKGWHLEQGVCGTYRKGWH
eukprot:1161662-Pelagomonas_calceolata.AAC.18